VSDNPFALSNIQRDSEGVTPANDNPFSLANIERGQQAELRGKLKSAVTVDPDQAAEADKLAKRYHVPQDVLARNLLDVKMQAAVDEADERLRTSPKLAQALRDKPWLAQQSHDDVGTLAQIEQFLRDTGGSAKAGVYNASKGAAGTFRAGAELFAPALDFLEPVTEVGGNPLRRLAEGFDMLAQQNAASAKAVTPKTTGDLSGGFQSGIQSLTQNLLTLPMAFLPGGQSAALAGMVSFTGGNAYQDARDKGLPMSQALPFAVSQASIEWATERSALGALVKDVKIGSPLFKLVTNQLKNEIPGEQIATVLQDLNEWAVLHPEKPFSAYLEERPSAAAQTLVATIVGVGGNVAVVKGIESVVNSSARTAAQVEETERGMRQMEAALQTAAQSKLRERNPETFKQLVQQMAEETDGAPTSVFIDAQVLADAGVNVAEMFPSAADQMDAALASNGMVQIDLGDVLTAVPGTPLEQVFLQNARASETALSMVEAKQASEQAGEFLKQEADRVMAEAQDQATWQASADTVKTTILEQLNTAGRFTPDVNEAYSTLVRDFYAVTASRQGITPEEMYARYPLRVMAQAQTAGPQLDQGETFTTYRGVSTTGTPNDYGVAGKGEYSSGRKQVAETYAGKGGSVEQRTVTLRNPLKLTYSQLTALQTSLYGQALTGFEEGLSAQFDAYLRQQGYDGVVLFDPEISTTVPEEVVRLSGETLAQSPAAFDGPETGSTPIGDATTIDVDGVQRPALNSNGQPIHPTLEGVRNFWRWFGDSKVVDASGRPLVVYHGSDRQVTVFDPLKIGENFGRKPQDQGFWFSADKDQALEYASNIDGRRAGKVANAVYLSLKNPTIWGDSPENRPLIGGFVKRTVDEGRDGVIFRNIEDGTGIVSDQYLVFTPTQIKSATGNQGTFDPQNPNILKQQARGTFSPSQMLITLGESSDLSTFLHESGHFFLEVMADLASQPNAPAEIQDDMGKLLKWFGVADTATWNAMTLDKKRPHHERFAESFEQYLLEGKAPNQELQPLFRRFRTWMVNVYKSLTEFMRGRNLKLNDEVRQVFDRMLATDEQIKQAEDAAGLLPDFDATNEAIEKLQARSLRDLKWTVNARSKALKALQKEAATLRKGVEEEVRAEVAAMPVYAAMRWLKKGEMVDPVTGEQIKADKGFRLNTETVAEMYPETALGNPDLQRLRGMTAKTGLHPAIVADMFGFESGDQLVRAIADAEPIASVIEGMTDRRMLERHGDIATPEAQEAAANEAVHNEARARSLATELKAQSDMLNAREQTGTASNGRAITVNALAKAAKEFGANLAARRRVKDLKAAAAQHRAAEARAGKRWQEATAKGKTEEAVQAKRDQVLNNAAVKALQEAQAEVQKSIEFFRRVTKGSNEKIVERGRDPDVVNAMRAILGAYDVAPRLEKGALEYMEIVARNDPVMYAALQPSVQGALMNAKPMGEMTMEELRGLTDELRSMWHLAERSRQSEIDGNLMDREDIEDELVARMQDLGVPDTMPGDTSAITPAEARARKLMHYLATATRVESWADRMGPQFTRYVWNPVKEAANALRMDKAKYIKELRDILQPIAKTFTRETIAAPELGYTFGKDVDTDGVGMNELLHAILHTGNDSNKRKLLLGREWATENADGTLDTSRWDAFIARMHSEGKLTKAHWDTAQAVWDLLEQTKPKAQKAFRAAFGRYFAEVTANEVVTPFGTYRGGYVPATADSRVVADAATKRLAEDESAAMQFAFPASPRGFTKSRTEYNVKLRLDLRTLSQHLDKVLLFSNMDTPVRDVRRVLTSKGVAYNLNRISPQAFDDILTPWLNRAAKQLVDNPSNDWQGWRMWTALRNRAGMAAMFGNVANAVQQFAGFSMAAVKVAPKHLVGATAQYVASPRATSEMVATKSAYMNQRMSGEISAMTDAVNDILLNPSVYENGKNFLNRHAYFAQTAIDNVMGPIVWTGAYNEALAAGQSEQDAVRAGDAAVRLTQGATAPEDISAFEAGSPFSRLFTQFAGYFNMQANLLGTEFTKVGRDMGLRKGAGRALYVLMFGYLVNAWVAEAIMQVFKGGPDDEDKDGEYLDDWLAQVFGWSLVRNTTAMVPVFGQAAVSAVNSFNSKPYDDRLASSPAISMLESAVKAPQSVYKAVVEDGKPSKAIRDVGTAVAMFMGLPVTPLTRPTGYLADVSAGVVEPTSAADAVRGAITGTPSPESKQR